MRDLLGGNGNGNGSLTDEQRRKVARLRRWVLALLIVLVFAAFVAPITVIWFFIDAQNETQSQIACVTVRSSIIELQAINRNGEVLDDIAHSLGLPVPERPFVPIPEVPPECVDT